MAERSVRCDGSVREPDGTVTLSVSLGIPYILAEVMSEPLSRALLAKSRFVHGNVHETWRLPDGQTFAVDQPSRFEFAELGKAIGTIRSGGKEIPVYQPVPRLIAR